jgi:hypothetical protein
VEWAAGLQVESSSLGSARRRYLGAAGSSDVRELRVYAVCNLDAAINARGELKQNNH